MANTDPTSASPVLTLKLSEAERQFLQDVLWSVRDGIREELEGGRGRVDRLYKWRREELAYDSLLIGLTTGSIVPSTAISETLGALVRSIDTLNEHERIVAEHAALLGLQGQVAAGAGR